MAEKKLEGEHGKEVNKRRGVSTQEHQNLLLLLYFTGVVIGKGWKTMFSNYTTPSGELLRLLELRQLASTETIVPKHFL